MKLLTKRNLFDLLLIIITVCTLISSASNAATIYMLQENLKKTEIVINQQQEQIEMQRTALMNYQK